MESEFSALFLLLSLCTHEGNFMLENCTVQNGNFIAALDICQKNRSELADVNQTREKIKSCEKEEMFMVNEVAVQTPVLDLLGCFQVSDNRNSTRVSSIPECFSHCHPLKTFGVSGQSRLHCFCINPNTNVVREQSLDPSRCRVDDSQSSPFMEVYAVLDDKKKSDEEHFQMNECRIITLQETIETTLVSASRVRGYCFYPFCRNRTDINSIPTKCEDSWDKAAQACLSKTNSYLADTIQLSDCHKVSKKIQNVFRTVTFWSSRRSYNADFSVKGNQWWRGITEVSKCVAVSENGRREVNCNRKNYFFCMQDAREFESQGHNVTDGDNGAQSKFYPITVIIIIISVIVILVVGPVAVVLILKRKLKKCDKNKHNAEDATSYEEANSMCEKKNSVSKITDKMKDQKNRQEAASLCEMYDISSTLVKLEQI